uniref:Uncharacterized protein n=1 Tax=Anguilla anguilla TaxID=7936 RepID=A0A0E9Q8I3_ANGAN
MTLPFQRNLEFLSVLQTSQHRVTFHRQTLG